MTPDHIRYLEKVGAKHRKHYGQFFTHPEVARFMVEWVLGSGEKTIFDPAFGLGAFWEPASDDSSIEFGGSEVDVEILDFWKASAEQKKRIDIANEDYLFSWGKTHANIVCNPPYNRFQKFFGRERVFKLFEDKLGLTLSGYTNMASTFLIKSLSELSGAGRLAYIMPLEFLNAGYGTVVKRRLIEDGRLMAIISLDCEKDIFPESITSVGIILYDASCRRKQVGFYTADSLHSLESVLETPPVACVELDNLDPESKWLPYFRSNTFRADPELSVSLDRYGRFSRGIATGANAFFVLRPSRARMLGIGGDEVVSCITKSAQIRQPVFGVEEYADLARSDAPVLLFRGNRTQSKNSESYIRSGELKGHHTRFLTKSRSPWYRTENREPAPLLLGVFSRGGYKVVRNRSRALNLTCFHGFQPNLFGMAYIDRLFLYLASASGRDILSLSARRYGDTLDKFEPNDLNSALVPSPEVFDKLSVEQVADAISHMEKTGKTPGWLDAFFEKLKVSESVP